MDVQTLAQVAAQNLPPDPTGGTTAQAGGPPAPPVQVLSIPQVGSDTATGSSGQPAGTLHLPQEIAKIFTGGSSSHVSISFQVAHNPNEIVTVFKNTYTGEVITQVPSEIMIKMAEFFDQVAGVVLDKSA